MIDQKYYDITDKTQLDKSDYWTNKLYNMAYDRVKDRKFPLIIPSYNRPDNKITNFIYEHTREDEPWEIYVITRQTQQQAYEDNETFKKCPGIHTLAFPDDEINDAGKVRKRAVEYFMDKADCIFMMDDDVHDFAYTVPYRRESGSDISISMTDKVRGEKTNFSRLLAMWQVAMEETIKKHDNVIITCPMIAGFSWAPDFCNSDLGIKIMSGAQVCCLGINLKACKKYDMNFYQSKGNGHEDKDFVIRALLAGCVTAEFRWLAYQCASMGTDLRNVAVKERMSQQHDEMYNNFKDVDFVKYITDRNDFKNVRINWNKATKYYNSLTGDNINRDNNAYDITKCFEF